MEHDLVVSSVSKTDKLKMTNVISDEIIIASIGKEKIDPENEAAVKEDGTIEFPLVESLALSFKNIYKMDNLVTLNQLRSLRLDNNAIEKIEGISHLVQLTWLDLSFNRIKVIEGLDTLTLLTDLTLFNNQISKLDNLEHLRNLQILSMGNNELASTEGLLYLRDMTKLRVLNLEGNPVCGDPEYRPFVLSHLDRLKYLDYALIDKTEVTLAREQYQDELEEYKEKKMLSDAARKREMELASASTVLEQANVLIIENLFAEMFKEDADHSKLINLPGLQHLYDDYSEKVKADTDVVKMELLAQHELLQQEKSKFEMVQNEILDKAQTESIQVREAHAKNVKKLLQKMQNHKDDPVTISNVFSQANDQCQIVFDALMGLESDAVEQNLELIDHFESNTTSISEKIKRMSTDHFRAVEDHENIYYDAMCQLAAQLLENFTSEGTEDDDLFSEETKILLQDKDTLTNTISTSHDIHIGKLLSLEDTKREQGNTMVNKVLTSMKDTEWNRNRTRVEEIINLRNKDSASITNFRDELVRVDEEFY